jgi:hypothetical protein
MNPVYYHKYTYTIVYTSSRPTGGFFIPATFPAKTCARLTKVNRIAILNSLSNCCKDPLFPTIKPAVYRVNKFLRLMLMTYDSRLITVFPY